MSYCDTCFSLIRSLDGACVRCRPTPRGESVQPAPDAVPVDETTASSTALSPGGRYRPLPDRSRTRLRPVSPSSLAGAMAASAVADRQRRTPVRSFAPLPPRDRVSPAPPVDPAGEAVLPRRSVPDPVPAGPLWTYRQPVQPVQQDSLASLEAGLLPGAGPTTPDRAHHGDQAAAPLPTRVPAGPGERLLQNALRFTRYALVIATVAVLAVPAINTLAEMNRAAHASWTAQAQLGRQRGERRTELSKALTALQELYAEIQKAAAQTKSPGPETAAWRRRWQEQLARIRVGYRLDGTTDFARAHLQAEEALRNAAIYLGSLEQQWAGGAGRLSSETKRSIDQSFERARGDLY